MVDTVSGPDVGWRRQQKKNGGRLDGPRDLLGKVAGGAQLCLIDPDVRLDAESLPQRGVESFDQPIDPLAVVAVRIADEEVVLVAWNIGHLSKEFSTAEVIDATLNHVGDEVIQK